MFKFSAKLQKQLLNHLLHFARGCGSPHSIMFLLVSATLSSLHTTRTGKAGRYIGIGYFCRSVGRELSAIHSAQGCEGWQVISGSRASFRRSEESQFITGGLVSLISRSYFLPVFRAWLIPFPTAACSRRSMILAFYLWIKISIFACFWLDFCLVTLPLGSGSRMQWSAEVTASAADVHSAIT